jgi:hypothetical protein
MNLWTISQALSKLCQSTDVCIFCKGAECPLESILTHTLQSCGPNTPVCWFATPEIWHKFLLESAQKEL